jgi:hypothetical protein
MHNALLKRAEELEAQGALDEALSLCHRTLAALRR